MSNTIRIKRRAAGGAAGAPATLANAELAFNEQDSTLYYGVGTGGAGGSATSIIPIAGPGAFVDKSSAQTISGVKTFSSSPQVPTATPGDSSLNAASTAFVTNAIGAAGGNQAPNTVYAGPVSGANAAPSFRALVSNDIPNIPSSKLTDKGAANGVASLDSGGKIPSSQLPASVTGSINYKGVLDASTAAYPASPSKGDYYVISVAGTISGHAYAVGDWANYNGTSWDFIDNSTKVSSVFGRMGAIVATAGDYTTDLVTEGTSNLYFTVARVLASALSGLSTASSAVITSADTVLSAFGKLQAQISLRLIASNNLSDLTNASTARTNLGLGTIATQNASSVAITGGTIDNVTFDGGTY